jgi:ribosomal protein L30E
MKHTLSPQNDKSSLRILRRSISALATLPETGAPVISAYFDLRKPAAAARASFLTWATGARNALPKDQRTDFDRARDAVTAVFSEDWHDDVRGIAVFARAGMHPMRMALPFHATLDEHFEATARPAIFPLVQLKDRFHRFVLVICTEETSRIMELTLGAVTEEILTSRPDQNHGIGRQLSREHFHHRREENTRRFMREQVDIITRLMERRGLNHLILAGHPRHVALLRGHLPKSVESRVVGSLYKAPNGRDCSPLLDEALDAFVEAEQNESRNAVERLHEQIRRHGLAVVGIHRCREVIHAGAASQLIISEELPGHDREELVRLAITHDIPIEVCENDELLRSHGGVGCLLRFRLEYLEHSEPGLRSA